MKPSPALALLLSLAMATTACGSHMNTPDIKQNPHPKMRYEITLTINGAPQGFDSVTGRMQYEVTNEKCAPYDEFIGIYRTPDTQYPPIAFTRVSDHVYTGTVYLDLLQDEDYYDLGVCHWSMNFATAILLINGNGVNLGPSMSLDEVASQKSVDIYFPIANLSSGPTPAYGDGGERMSASVAGFMGGPFSITMSSKEVTP